MTKRPKDKEPQQQTPSTCGKKSSSGVRFLRRSQKKRIGAAASPGLQVSDDETDTDTVGSPWTGTKTTQASGAVRTPRKKQTDNSHNVDKSKKTKAQTQETPRVNINSGTGSLAN